MDFVLAALFALIAGFGTAFSPCVLPVLPLALICRPNRGWNPH
jgi:thiol:disulfide interchange protein